MTEETNSKASLLAFAEAAERFQLKRPAMTQDPVLRIKNGWHPLYAMCIPPGQYIGNDTVLDALDPDRAAMVGGSAPQ